MKQETKFKDTEIGLIPEDWEIRSVSEVSEISLGGTPKTSIAKYWNGDVKWASAKDVSNCKLRYIGNTERTVTKEGIDNSAAKILPENTIVITSRGTVGELALLSEPMSFNQTCYGLKAKENMDSLFLYYNLKNSISRIKSISYGTVFSTITVRTFDEIKLAYPSLNEQNAIAKILSDLDSKIELLQKQNKTLEVIGQAIFKHWFVDFEFPNEEGKPYKSSGGEMVFNEELESEIPKGWEVSKIGTKLKVILGGTPDRTKKEYWNGDVNWINSGKVNEFRITEPSEKITKEGLEKSATKLLPKGTVVLAITGATLGQISRLEIDSCANQSVIGILENDVSPSEYLFFWIKKTIDDIIRWQTGGAQQHINKGNVENSFILIPPSKIIKEYLRIARSLFNKIYINCFLSQNLSKIRDSLLPKLMSGKIRVPNNQKIKEAV